MDKKPGLSPRQTEIMHLAAEGLTDKEIAQRTGLSVGTLRSHWDRMRARLGASSRGEVIARIAEEMRESLMNELQALRHVLTRQRTFVWTADANGVVDYVNDWFVQFSGLPAECLMGEGCRAIMPDEEKTECRLLLRQAQREGRGYQTTVRFRAASGALIPHRVEIFPLELVEGRVVRWIGTARECGVSEAVRPTSLPSLV